MSGRARYQPDTWEKVVATCNAVLIIATVLFLVVKDRPFSDPNFTQFVRILLSLACGVPGAVIPGFLNVDVKGTGMIVRAGGALGLFVVTYFFAPSVQTQNNPDPGPPVAAGPRDPLESPGGYRAEFVKLPGEGNGITVVWKDGEKVTEVRDSRPISFSPTDDIPCSARWEPTTA